VVTWLAVRLPVAMLLVVRVVSRIPILRVFSRFPVVTWLAATRLRIVARFLSLRRGRRTQTSVRPPTTQPLLNPVDGVPVIGAPSVVVRAQEIEPVR